MQLESLNANNDSFLKEAQSLKLALASPVVHETQEMDKIIYLDASDRFADRLKCVFQSIYQYVQLFIGYHQRRFDPNSLSTGEGPSNQYTALE